MSRLARSYLAVAMLSLIAVACAPAANERMVYVKPREGFEQRLIELRERRDRFFREDPASPLLPEDRGGFAGLEYFPPRAELYLVGPVRRYAEPQRFEMVTTAGTMRPCERIGWLDFEVDGQPARLQVYRMLDNELQPEDEGLFLPFADGTTGGETYPAGRYVNLNGSRGGPYVLDFNRAYNPSCAYGRPERFACPVTPPENRLPFRIEAGERGYRQEVAG